MAYNEEVTMMMSVVPGAMTGISTMMGGLVSINNVFMDMTRQIDASFGLIDASIITASTVIAQFGIDAAKAFGEFEQGLKVAQMVSGQTSQEMDILRQKANEFSVSYRTDIEQITEGLQTLGRAGLNSASEQTEVLENGLNTAKLEGRELNSVLEELIQNTALLGGDLKSSNFGEDSQYVNDLLVATSMTAPITTHDVSETLKYSGGIAAAAGANIESEQGKAILEDYMGAIAAFAQKGVTGSIAGTALRAFFNKPATQDSSVTEALASIHLKPEYLWEEDENTMKPVSEQIAIIKNQMEDLNISTMDQLQIWSKIVGGKMGQQMMKLDSEDIKSLTSDIRAADDAGSLAAGTFQTFQSKMKEMTEQGQVAFRQFGEYAAKALTPFIEILTKILEFFSNPIVSGAIFVGAFSLIASGINRIRKVFSLLKEELATFKKALLGGNELYSIRPSSIRKSQRFNSGELQRKYPGMSEAQAYAKEKAFEREERLLRKGYSIEEISILDASKKGRKTDKYMQREGYVGSHMLSSGQLDKIGLTPDDINDNFIIQDMIRRKEWKPEYSKTYYESGQSFDAVFQKHGEEIFSTMNEIYKKEREEIRNIAEKKNDEIKKELEEKKKLVDKKYSHRGNDLEPKVPEFVGNLSTINDFLTEDEKSDHPVLSSLGSYFDRKNDSLNSLRERKKYQYSNVAFDNAKFIHDKISKELFIEDLEKVIRAGVDQYDTEELLNALTDKGYIEEEYSLEAEKAIEEKKQERQRASASKYADKIADEVRTQQKELGAGYSIDQYALMDSDSFAKRFRDTIPSHVDYNLVQSQLLEKAGITDKYEAEKRIQILESMGYTNKLIDLRTDNLMNPFVPKDNTLKDYNPYGKIGVNEQGLPIYETEENLARFDSKSLEKMKDENRRRMNDTAIYLAKYFNLPLDEKQARDFVYGQNLSLTDYVIGDSQSGMLKTKIPKDILFGPKPGLDDFADIDIGMGQTMSDIIGDKDTKEGRIQLRLEYEKFLKWYEETNKKINQLIREEMKDLENVTKDIEINPRLPYKQGEKAPAKEINNVSKALGGRGKNKKESLQEIESFVKDLRDSPDLNIGSLDKDFLTSLSYRELQKVAQATGIKANQSKDVLMEELSNLSSNKDRLYIKGKRPDIPITPKPLSLLNTDYESLGITKEHLGQIPDEIGKKLFSDWDDFKEYSFMEKEMEEYKKMKEEERQKVEKFHDEVNKQIEKDENLKNKRQSKKDYRDITYDYSKSDYIIGRQKKRNAEDAAFVSIDTFIGKVDSTFKKLTKRLELIEKYEGKKASAGKQYFNGAAEDSLSKALGRYGAGLGMPGYGEIHSEEYGEKILKGNKDVFDRVASNPHIRMDNYGVLGEKKSISQRVSSGLSGFFDNAKEQLTANRPNRTIGYANATTKFQKLTNVVGNVTDKLGGGFLVATEVATMAIEAWQQEFQNYCEKLKEAGEKLTDAYSKLNSADSALERTFKEGNPDAEQEEINQMMYDTYEEMGNKMAQALTMGEVDWLNKLGRDTETGPKYEYDEEAADGTMKETQEELTDEENYEKALKENTGALYAAANEVSTALNNYVKISQDSWWGSDGWTGWVTDQWGGLMDKLAHPETGGSTFTGNDNEFLLTQSQADENYSGYKEMAGLMMEDFKDAGGEWLTGMKTMMGEDAQELSNALGESTRDYLKGMARFSAGRGPGGLTTTQNAKLQQSMKQDPKTWKKLGKELAKRDTNKKLGKDITKNQNRIRGLTEKIRSTVGKGFKDSQIQRAAYIQQLQDMKAIADQAVVPMMQTNLGIAGQTLSATGQVGQNTGNTVNTTGSTNENAAIIAGLVAIIARQSAKAQHFDDVLAGGEEGDNDYDGEPGTEADKQLYKLATQDGMNADKFYQENMKNYNSARGMYEAGFGSFGGVGNKPIWERGGLFSNTENDMAGGLGYTRLIEATAKMTGYGYDKISAMNKAREFAEESKGKKLSDIFATVDKNYTQSEQFKDEIVNAYLLANDGEGDGSGGGGGGDGGGDSGDKDNTGTKKERVDLVLCNKKEIPKLNVNLFKKPPSFTVLNKNFKLRDVKINTQDTPKAVMASIKNAFIDVQKRSDPKIIQDEEAAYDPVEATDGNAVPSGSAKTKTD